MAIIIPSKMIYSVDNEKIPNNTLDRIEINATKVATKNDYDIVVAGYTDTGLQAIFPVVTNVDYKKGNQDINERGLVACAMYYIKPQRFSKTISVERLKDNTYIENIFLEKNRIGISIVGDEEKGQGSAIGFYDQSASRGNFKNLTNSSITKNNNIRININPSLESVYEIKNSFGITVLTAKAGVDISKITTNNTETFDTYEIKIDAIVGYEEYKLGGQGEYATGLIDYPEINLTGTYTKYTPKKVELTFNGNTLSIDLQNELVVLGNKDSKKSFSVANNELLQLHNTINGNNSLEEEYNKTLNSFKKGKETAIIRCAIGEYYDEENTLCISTQNNIFEIPYYKKQIKSIIQETSLHIFNIGFQVEIPEKFDIKVKYRVDYTQVIGGATSYEGELTIIKNTKLITTRFVNMNSYKPIKLTILGVYKNRLDTKFPIGAEVVPYKYGLNGEDEPMSLTVNNTLKKFIVIGNNIFFDGAVWQELTLIEK